MERKSVGIVVAGGLLALAAVGAGNAAPGPEHAELDKRLAEVAKLPGEPSVLESMGVSRGDIPLRSLENRARLAGPGPERRRLVLVGGLDGNDRGVDAVLGAVRWFKTEAPAAVRAAWDVVALPCGNPEGWAQLKPTNDSGGKPSVKYPPQAGFYDDKMNPEGRYIWRWVGFQAPDVVVEVRGGNRLSWLAPEAKPGLMAALKASPLTGLDSLSIVLNREGTSGLGTVPAVVAEARSTDGPALLAAALQAAGALSHSPLRETISKRLARSPLDVASILAAKYPQTPSIAYIPAVSWCGALRLARLKNDDRLREKVRAALAPYLAGTTPPITGNPDVAKLAGYIAFADLAEADNNEAAKKLALEGAKQYVPEKADDPARYGRYWTDDMFMTVTLLGRAGKLSGDVSYYDLAARTLTQYSAKLQRPDGLFVHSPEAPHCWGRGNGFASLGLMEALTYLPPTHPRRAELLTIYRKQMAALRGVQTPEGTWREVIDHPESYREITATAMNLSAMARGIRLGWLGQEYRPVVDRAWQGLNARIADDGALADVCTGTGAGPTLRYYYDRPAIFGPDDRGGAMSLLAALEMAELGSRG